MVSVSKVEAGPQVISASVRSTIQSIKEIVGSHSDADIYVALKEAGMDPNETTQKLLLQDPFHEVKRKRDRKKLNSGIKGLVNTDTRKNTEIRHTPLKDSAYPDHNPGRDLGASQAFRVVRDNRVNHNSTENSKPVQSSVSKNERVISGVYVKSSDSKMKSKDVIGGITESKEMLDKNPAIPNAGSRAQTKANGSQQRSTDTSSASVFGVYSSSSDPIHVPSLHPKSASTVGAIRREVGVVGHRRQMDGNAGKQVQGNPSSNAQVSQDSFSRDSAKPMNSSYGGEASSKNVIPESGFPGASVNKPLNNHHRSRAHQPMGYQRATQPNMEWKPKSSLKTSVSVPEEIRSPPEKNTGVLKKDAAELEDNISQLKLSETQNVIIAPHIRVSEIDRCRLIFGSLDAGSHSGVPGTAPSVDAPSVEPSKRTPDMAQESSEAGPSSSNQLDATDGAIQFSESESPDSTVLSGSHLVGKNELSDSQNLESYADVGLVQTASPSYTPQPRHHEENELSSFSGYDPQMGYDSYFRPAIDDTLRVPVMPSSQEVLSSHAANNIPVPSVAMVQHQQQQLAQMYPQLHVSHFGNLMPYRQFLSPVYVPSMPVAGYSNTPTYHHPSNGNSFVLMPGSNSHVNPSGAVKYGVQQFKPVPTANMNGYGNFTSPTGYAINTNGAVGSAAGHDDSSRIKYKDNLYAPNPQPETAEIWMSPRDLQGLHSASYYSMAGQTPHPAYLASHGSHASFNAAAAVAQSSHMQFPTAMYHHAPQPTAIPNPHLVPTVSANVGVGMPAPPAPGGAYQQAQLSHLNWTGNF